MSIDKVTFLFNLDLTDVPDADQAQAKKDVADYLVEAILADADEGLSSVSGKKWAPLSDEYKKFKEKYSHNNKANLELTGALLDSLTTKQTGDSIEIGFFDADEVPIADGHNNFSGDSTLPLRQSIPKPGQNFRTGILEEVDRILSDYKPERALNNAD